MKHQASTLSIIAVLVATGCIDRPLVKVEPGTESYIMEEFKQTSFDGVDILVVVDNSVSMGDEQENLIEEFPLLIRALLDPPMGGSGQLLYPPALDLHIGVISTDMGAGGYLLDTCEHEPLVGDDGVLRHSPAPGMAGCDEAFPSYLSYPSTEADEGLIQKMATDFGCIATLGTDGCGFEQQLEAALKGLSVHAQPGGPNAGFLRQDSILMILFVTDEDDCSVSDPQIFDRELDLGHVNMRCFYHPEMIHGLARYVEGYRSLRTDWQDKLILGFITGVPLVEQCQTTGDLIAPCLALTQMIPMPDPLDPTRLSPSCNTDSGLAYPPVRLVELAMQFGENALVQSICTDDFGPAIEHLSEKLTGVIGSLCSKRELEVEKLAGDSCLCEASCTIIEQLDDMRPCPPGLRCYEPGGAGTGCATRTDEEGQLHTLCVIPQAPTRLDRCELVCSDPLATLTPQAEGWYYMPYGTGGCPEVVFSDSVIPADGSRVYLQCESMICPDSRQCGPDDFPASVCCDSQSYCDQDAPSGPTCVIRPE